MATLCHKATAAADTDGDRRLPEICVKVEEEVPTVSRKSFSWRNSLKWNSDRKVVTMMSMSAILSGVTAHKISKTITFLSNEFVVLSRPPQGGARPLLLLLPWLGSQPRGLAKYCDIYLRNGFDVLIVESRVSQFLWPKWGLDYGMKVLEVLQSDRFVWRPLLVHAFSVGGYTFSQLLVHICRNPGQYDGLIRRLRGQVYDSLVMGSLDRMAVGLGRSLLPQGESLVRAASMLYFRAFKRHTVDYFNTNIDIFWHRPIQAPALFFSSENDPMCDHLKMKEMIEDWRKQGVRVDCKAWKDSTHAGHLRDHPQEYLSTLQEFIHSLSMVPLKAKM
ncbi:transmembrane protein 53-like isoform X3 [Brienomyrus brachyistius]|uniref:transmembrane protein 53-like isoform X3 n=1 Tax=Brienomyrus brachyistius TaxID=42636 RepID=UPI0020B1ACFD|nr:transmembrane protein 53-like isoform X3 [Brienomyrus brachyistius]